jgi:hypothetical protein
VLVDLRRIANVRDLIGWKRRAPNLLYELDLFGVCLIVFPTAKRKRYGKSKRKGEREKG